MLCDQFATFAVWKQHTAINAGIQFHLHKTPEAHYSKFRSAFPSLPPPPFFNFVLK